MSHAKIDTTLTGAGQDTGYRYFYDKPILGISGNSTFDMTLEVYWSLDRSTDFFLESFTGLVSDSISKYIELPKSGAFLIVRVTSYTAGEAQVVIQE